MSTLQETVSGYLHAGKAADAADGSKPKNVNDTERLVSAAAGALLIKFGLKHRGLLGLGTIIGGGSLVYRGYTGHCSVYNKLGMNSTGPASGEKYFKSGIHVEGSVTVSKPAEELYTFWKNFENLPTFMDHLVSVTVKDAKTSSWVAKGPMGTQVKWDAEIINDEPGTLIAWRSLGGAQVDNAGSVRFVPATSGRGTEVRVSLDYVPPGRVFGKWVAKLFGEEPTQQIHHDLRRFKQLMETGVIATVDGQSQGQKLPSKKLGGTSQSPMH